MNHAALCKEVASWGVDSRNRVDIPIDASGRWTCKFCKETTDINKVLCRWCKKDGRVRETAAEQLRLLKEYKNRKGDKKKPLSLEPDTANGYTTQRPKGKKDSTIADLKDEIAHLRSEIKSPGAKTTAAATPKASSAQPPGDSSTPSVDAGGDASDSAEELRKKPSAAQAKLKAFQDYCSTVSDEDEDYVF